MGLFGINRHKNQKGSNKEEAPDVLIPAREQVRISYERLAKINAILDEAAEAQALVIKKNNSKR